ncbi:histone acetyltransferase type B catalic subunit [Klebsormidium nitens]|uniref:histone acetyltransferase n=1 Tax=Klebsormidium nitens TaxID=105231 RepID=A0A1Y1IGE0_KLENI|nr:histone acetyltransferase type B catalic subunit [Klebsormidium nitens]|eukprot:GAQ87777.1 histone acetyltransferase type B catalic subunit [Klebsormidium nitens]
MAEEPDAKRAKLLEGRFGAMLPPKGRPPSALNEFKCNANEAITFHLVYAAEQLDLSSDTMPASVPPRASFHPLMTHQLFGDDEIIKGYKNLKVDIFLHATTFYAYLDIKYEEKLEKLSRKQQPDNILEKLKVYFENDITEDREAFVRSLPVYNAINFLDFEPQTLPASTSAPSTSSSHPSELYEVVQLPLDKEAVRQWHNRLQVFLIFFIDGGNYIDTEERDWDLLVALERPSDWDGRSGSAKVAGFCTVRSFYSYPESTRLRLSQLVVLPSFQKRGHGSRLIESVYHLAQERGCYDVTTEDPTDDMNQLRDEVDVKRLQERPEVKEAVERALAAAASQKEESSGATEGEAPKQKNPLAISPSLLEDLRKSLKINKKNIKKCWEVLLSLHLDKSPPVTRDAFLRLQLDHGARRAETAAGGGGRSRGYGGGGANGHAKGGLLKALQKAVRKEEESDDGGEGSEAEESDGGVAVQKQTPEEAAREKQEQLLQLYGRREEQLKKHAKKLLSHGS